MFTYVPQKKIDRQGEGCDYGADRIVIAEFPNIGTRLLWQKGGNRWKGRGEQVYECGYYVYQSIKGSYFDRLYRRNGAFSVDLTEGKPLYEFEGQEVPRLNNVFVKRTLIKIATSQDSAVYQCVEYANAQNKGVIYKRGKTVVCGCKTSDQMSNELSKTLEKIGAI